MKPGRQAAPNERDALARLRAAPPGDETAAALTQTTLLALVRAGEFRRASRFAAESGRLSGLDPLARSELLPLLAVGDAEAAGALATELADAPVTLGGHGLRAAVRTLLGRDADAAADGRAFVDESREVHRSLAAWRAVARRYGPASAATLSRYGFLHAELEAAFPGIRPWAGEALDGRTLVVQLVQGLGDQIQGLRLAAVARQAGARVLVGCDDRLRDLVTASDLADAFLERPLSRTHTHGPADFGVVGGGWLHEAGLQPETYSGAPYLGGLETSANTAEEQSIESTDFTESARASSVTSVKSVDSPERASGHPAGPRLRVGVVWAGNPEFALEPTRGMPYAALKRLVAATPDVAWVSLMRPDHPRAGELAATPATRRVVDAGPTLHTLADTGRLLGTLDVLVTTDSAPAHLAGALGVTVWTLLGPTFDWRWRRDGESTPLYDSMRLVRDAVRGDWNAVADEVAAHLAAVAPRAARLVL